MEQAPRPQAIKARSQMTAGAYGMFSDMWDRTNASSGLLMVMFFLSLPAIQVEAIDRRVGQLSSCEANLKGS
jgi:hypothetical protein